MNIPHDKFRNQETEGPLGADEGEISFLLVAVFEIDSPTNVCLKTEIGHK